MNGHIGVGHHVEDRATPYKGIVVATCDESDGSHQVRVVAPWLHDGKPVSAWIDVKRLRIVDNP